MAPAVGEEGGTFQRRLLVKIRREGVRLELEGNDDWRAMMVIFLLTIE